MNELQERIRTYEKLLHWAVRWGMWKMVPELEKAIRQDRMTLLRSENIVNKEETGQRASQLSKTATLARK